MKKKKLSLDALEVKSFVTSFENGQENTLKGGDESIPPTAPGCCFFNDDTFNPTLCEATFAGGCHN